MKRAGANYPAKRRPLAGVADAGSRGYRPTASNYVFLFVSKQVWLLDGDARAKSRIFLISFVGCLSASSRSRLIQTAVGQPCRQPEKAGPSRHPKSWIVALYSALLPLVGMDVGGDYAPIRQRRRFRHRRKIISCKE